MGSFILKSQLRSRPKLRGHNVSLCVAIGAGLTFSGVASAQTATDDEFQAIKRTVPQLVGNVLDNDGGATAVNSIYTSTPFAYVRLDTDGDMIYQPDKSIICAAETEVIGYTLSTGSSNAVVNINLLPPVMPDSYSVEAGQQLAADVQSNDPLPDSAYGNVVDQLNVFEFFPASSGSVVQTEPGVTNRTGQFTYMPNAGFSGIDTFGYQAIDPDLGCGWNAMVDILVTPVANQDVLVTTGGAQVCSIDVLENDLGSGLEVVSVVQPAGGSVTISADDTLCFQPNQGFLGTASFAYTVEDSAGSQTGGTVIVEIGAAPVSIPTLGGGPLGFMAVLLGWLGWRRFR